MFLGASSPARRARPRLVDLNLIPPEYRRRPFPALTAGLALAAIGSLLLLYAAFYVKTYSNLETARLSTRVSQANAVVLTATGNPTAQAHEQRLRAMRDDYETLAKRQIHWGDVFQTIGDVPAGVQVKSATQAGFGITVTGSAINPAAAARYVNQLRGSGLFVNASIQMRPASGPADFLTPTTTPNGSGRPPTMTPRSAPIILPPTPRPRSISPPVRYPTSRPTTRPTPRHTATPTRTPTITRTPTATRTPTPAFDFVLVSSQKSNAANPMVGTTDITGEVLDKAGKPFPNIPVEIDSEGQPSWSATASTTSDGTFDFAVNHGKFKVFVVGGNAQPALDLYTGTDGVAGAYNYRLVFQATFSGSIPPTPYGTSTPTLTPTTAPTETPTPISAGANIAADGCATAYLVQNGAKRSVLNGSSPDLATDGNTGTEWNAGIAPSSGTQVIWQWQLPGSGQTVPNCNKPGLSDAEDQIDAFQLIPDQSTAGDTTHELWLYSDAACTVNVANTTTAYYTWDEYTSAGQVLPLAINPPLPIRCVIIRTLEDPSNVAWEEVQIYQELEPPDGFPTGTPTPGAPTATPTSTSTPPPPTATTVPTATSTPLPTEPSVFGKNIAPGNPVVVGGITPGIPTPTPCTPGKSSGPSDPCSAIDGTPSTYWAPSAGAPDPEDFTILFAPDPTPVQIEEIRVQVRSAGTPEAERYSVYLGRGTMPTPACQYTSLSSGFPDNYVLRCVPPAPSGTVTPWPSVVSVAIRLEPADGRKVDGNYGIREAEVWAPNPVNGLSRAGRGQGPGNSAPVTSTLEGNAAPDRYTLSNERTPPADSSLSAASPTPAAPTSGPIDFTIILEVRSGKGYP